MNAVYAVRRLYPFGIRAQTKIFNFYFRLVNMKESNIVKKVFNQMVKFDSLGITDCNCLSNILQSLCDKILQTQYFY